MKTNTEHVKSARSKNPMACFSEGGAIAETPDQLMARISKTYGATGAGKSTPEPDQVPAPKADKKPEEKPKEGGLFNVMNTLKGRKSQIDKAVDGYANGGKIKGPGTKTSDSIPAKVKQTGENIKVSTDERILSGAQDAFLEKFVQGLGYPSLEAFLVEGTGQPVGPTIKGGMQAAAFGADVEDMNYQRVNSAQIGNQAKPQPMPGMPDVLRNGNSFTQAAPSPVPSTAVTAAPLAANPMTRMSLADATAAVPIQQSRPTAQPMNPSMSNVVTGSRAETAPAAAVPVRDMHGNDMTQTNKNKSQMGDPLIAAKPATTPVATQPAIGAEFGSNTDFGSPAPLKSPAVNILPKVLSGGFDAAPAPTASPAVMAANAQAGAQERTFQSPSAATTSTPAVTTNDPTGVQERTFQAPTAANAPFSSRVGNSFTERNTVMDASNPLTTINMSANNESMARANAIRQSMIDSQAGARVDRGADSGIIKDTGREESQALMDKWGREDAANAMVQEMGRNPKAAAAIASVYAANQGAETNRNGQALGAEAARNNDATHRTGQTLAASTAERGQDVTARGQDIAAQTHAAQLAGNPLTNELTRTQTAVAQSGLDDKKAHTAMVAELDNPKTTPERRKSLIDTLLAAQGKTANDNRYLPHNIKTYNDMGQVTGESAVMFDKQAGQYVTPGGQQAEKLPMPKGYTAESMTKEAEAAIKAGKSRAAVAAELAKYGVAFK